MNIYSALKVLLGTANLLTIKDEVRDVLHEAHNNWHRSNFDDAIQYLESMPFYYGKELLEIGENLDDVNLSGDLYEACKAVINYMTDHGRSITGKTIWVKRPSQSKQAMLDHNARNDEQCRSEGIPTFGEWEHDVFFTNNIFN